MSITRADVADLRRGDVVRVTGWYGVAVEGALTEGTRSLWLGQHVLVRDVDGSVGHWAKPDCTLTVISRAPRPLYVNHPRTEPVPGDVVRDASERDDERCWWFVGGRSGRSWIGSTTGDLYVTGELPARLRLLVDGETGQVVP